MWLNLIFSFYSHVNSCVTQLSVIVMKTQCNQLMKTKVLFWLRGWEAFIMVSWHIALVSWQWSTSWQGAYGTLKLLTSYPVHKKREEETIFSQSSLRESNQCNDLKPPSRKTPQERRKDPLPTWTVNKHGGRQKQQHRPVSRSRKASESGSGRKTSEERGGKTHLPQEL
jgi:hypothetical protein